MMRWIIFTFVVLFGCAPDTIHNQKPDEKPAWVYMSFIRLDDATQPLSWSNHPKLSAVYIYDAPIKSEFIIDKDIWHVFAPNFGIAISAPAKITKNIKAWTYKNCTFTPSEYATQHFGDSTKFYSFHSTCENSKYYNDYLLSSSGDLLAFEIYEKDETGNKINSITFIAVRSK